MKTGVMFMVCELNVPELPYRYVSLCWLQNISAIGLQLTLNLSFKHMLPLHFYKYGISSVYSETVIKLMHRIFTVFHLVLYQYPECFTHILMFLAFGTSSFEIPAMQCFLDQHKHSSQSQPHSVFSTYVVFTLMATQHFLH
jgi:hypothetical protein